MTDTLPLGEFEQDAQSGLLLPARTRRVVTPWADLNATDIPVDYPQVSPDLLQALAILVAQGVNGATLLKANASGDLRVGSRINAIAKLVAPLPGGATIAMIDDTSDFFAGDHVSLLANGAPSSTCTDVVIRSIDSPTQMTFVATCSALSFAVGDYVVGEQLVNIRDIFNAIGIGGFKVNTAIGAATPTDDRVMNTTTINGHRRFAVDTARSVDMDGVQININGAPATLTFGPFGAGFRVIVKDIVAALDNRSAANFVTGFAIRDGASGVGTIKWFTAFQALAATVDRDQFNNVLFRGADNAQVTVEFTGSAANIVQDLYVSGYIEG